MGMENGTVFKLIDEQIGELEDISTRNTVLMPGALSSIATLRDLKRRIEESLEQVPELQD